MLALVSLAALIPSDLIGPDGVAVGAVALVIILGRLHLQNDARTQARSDEWQRLYLATRREFNHLANADERALGIEPPS